MGNPRRLVASLLVAWMAIATLGGGPALAASDTGPRSTVCGRVEVPVTVGGTSGPIAGTLCRPPGATTVQLLVHGWTYNQYYFDIPYQPETYSYARAANRAGYATLAIDRLGAGASLRPPSAFGTFNASVNAVHAVVQALRAGSLGPAFDKVVLVGHSLGSITSVVEAGQYHDVDAIITTGFTHSLNYLNAYPKIGGRDHPARNDPKFAHLALDPAYVTSLPGTRDFFTHQPNTDPALVRLDETLLKDTDTLVEAATLPNQALFNTNRTVNIPVLVVIGDEDEVFCGLQTADCTSSDSVRDFERRWYGPDAVVEAFLIPGTGHSIHLEKTAPQATARMTAFVDRHIGPGGGQVGSIPGARPPLPSPPPDAANTVAVQGQATVIDLYAAGVEPIPGLGTTRNPIPQTGDFVATVGNLNGQLLGTVPHEVIGFPSRVPRTGP